MRGGGVLTRLDRGESQFLAATVKKVIYHGLVHPEMHNFYMKTNPRQQSGNAIACASVAPMQLHCRICHTEINIRLIIAQRRGNGGQSLITFLAFWRSSLNFS